MDPFIGQIVMFGGNFAPRGWAQCNGQLLPIAANSALFSLLGTMYGGDGRTTFGLPDLRGRVAVHVGNGPGLTDRKQGSKGGSESVTLTAAQLPAHTHAVQATKKRAGDNDPAAKVLARSESPQYAAAGDPVRMGTEMIASTGGSQAHDNMPPYQAINYIIALQGVFPSRS